MLKLNVQTDCGNAPRKELLRDFTAAFGRNDADFILSHLADDVQWEMVGVELIEGKADAEKSLENMLDESMTELTISNIITHGDTAAVNGTMEFVDGSTFGFCDVYVFDGHGADALIKEIHAYIVEVESQTL